LCGIFGEENTLHFQIYADVSCRSQKKYFRLEDKILGRAEHDRNTPLKDERILVNRKE